MITSSQKLLMARAGVPASGIETTGLTLYVDAGIPASYSGTGTSWYDISGNGHVGTINGNPTYTTSVGGEFNFDGVGDYISFSTYQSPADDATTSFTWNLWSYRIGTTFNTIMGIRYTPSLNDFAKLTEAGNFEWYPNPQITPSSAPTSIWNNVCIVKAGTAFTYYLNGSVVGSTTNTQVKPQRNFFLGGDPGGRFSTSIIANAAVYNLALSPTQVASNFEALRGRYGV